MSAKLNINTIFKSNILLSAFLLSMLLISSCFAKSYSIESATLDYYINSDGSIIVVENITYVFESGNFTQIYLQKPIDMNISDTAGICVQKDCKFFEQNLDGWHELVLESNFENEKVTAIFEYKLHNQIFEQKDTVQFFYKLWGDQWSEKLENLNITIHLLPDEYDYEFFLHPSILNYEVEAGSTKIHISSKEHPKLTYLEINLLMPKKLFYDLPPAFDYIEKQSIIKGETLYVQNQRFQYIVAKIAIFVPLFIILVSFLSLYLLFGREKSLLSLNYNAKYERESIPNFSPSFAGHILSQSQKPSFLCSEIMMLWHYGFLEIETRTVETIKLLLKSKSKKLFFRLAKPKSNVVLNQPQKEVLKMFTLAYNSITASNNSKTNQNEPIWVCMDDVEKHFSKDTNFGTKFFDILEKNTKKYIDTKPNIIFSAVCGICLFCSFFSIFILSILFDYSIFTDDFIFLYLVSVFTTIVISIFLIFFVHSNPSVLGKWTDDGRVIEKKCANFKKYLEHFGSFSHKEALQVKLWGEYLAYATAFGIADKVLSQLKSIASDATFSQSDLDTLFLVNASMVRLSYNSYYNSSVLRSSYSSSSGVHSASFGGGAGGGGGGGGAR